MKRRSAGSPRRSRVFFKAQGPQTDPNAALYRVERSNNGLSLAFEFSDGRTDTKKSFSFTQDRYLVKVTSQITANGVMLPHSLEWRGGFGDQTVTNPASVEHTLSYNLASSKLVVNEVKAAKNGPVSSSGEYSFAGLEDSFFAGVFLPASTAPVELTTFSDPVPDAAGKDVQRIGAGVGGEGLNTFSLYVGPKDTEILARVDPKLEQLIDWGWFGIIAKPLFPGPELDGGTSGAQLRLGYRGGHRRDQPSALPAAYQQHEIRQKDAGAAASNRRD